MSQNHQSSNPSPIQEDEISLLDILLFLKRSWIIIAMFGAIGLATAVIYLLIAPKQYQAIAQIQMAQISAAANNNNNNNNINPLGINIEEPSLLIARMSFPTSFTSETSAACGLDGKENATSILAKSIKLSQPKGVPNVVELKTTASNPDLAQHCASAIYELIKTSQDKIVSPYIAEAKIKLADDEVRLAKAKDLVLKADKSGSVMSAAYLSTRDEIRYLLDEIAALQNVVASNINRATRLVAPIYVSDAPISPKKQVTLVAGLLGGLFLGLLIAFGRQLIPKIKAQLASNPQS
jgi:LPS O-antigen subunit length determinant protein (WzzB/FepE family)